ncbi:helix-turn-helix transcriptional regulator [Acrocarpospora catenulata]|uniref:helix-turn-helix transcriptional regulator n=1 Tax=Acrocarpospora catenulata TaxID=2836182 RepID=UPI001BD9F072|nr:helix-turn-helix transcriptional regulator [Acrocarpospora catenulata]
MPHRWVILALLAATPLPLVLGPGLKTTFYLGDVWNVRPYPLLPVLVLAELVPLWWSRGRPVAALAATGTAFLTGQAFDLPSTTADLGLLVALFMVGAHARRRDALLTMGVTAAMLAAFMVAANATAARLIGDVLTALVVGTAIAALPTLLGCSFAAVRHVPAQPPEPAGSPLTRRELDILQMVSEGMTNAEIADHLVIGRETVKTHVRNILAKLGARDRTHAVTIAHRGNLLG